MFSCYAHGWSHIEKPCPLCCPIEIYTSSGTQIDLRDNRSYDLHDKILEIDDLKKEIGLLRCVVSTLIDYSDNFKEQYEMVLEMKEWIEAEELRKAREENG